MYDLEIIHQRRVFRKLATSRHPALNTQFGAGRRCTASIHRNHLIVPRTPSSVLGLDGEDRGLSGLAGLRRSSLRDDILSLYVLVDPEVPTP